jgi:dTDP-4-dehydrorhamnose 3,5-epimerase
MPKKRSLKIDYEDVPLLQNFPLFRDERGYFSPTVLQDSWIQSNISFNEKPLVFRGMHYQEGSFSQSKLVKVFSGKIIDFIVDIRPESINFGTVESFLMEPGNVILVPRGYAHGFLTLEPNTLVEYFVDNSYSPKHEGAIAWNTLEEVEEIVREILEEENQKMIILEKDKNAESWEQFTERILTS